MKSYVIDIADPAESAPSSIAAARALLKPGDRVCLFHHTFHPRLVDGQNDPDNRLLVEAQELLMRARRERLHDFARQMSEFEVTCQVVWAENGWHALIEHVTATRADMLVVQSHRPNRWRPLARANEDWQLIRHCPVPLLLSRPGCDHQYKNILAAVDPLHADDKPAELDYRIVEHAAEISEQQNAQLCVLNVATPLSATSPAAAPAGGLAVVDEPMIDAHRARLQAMLHACDAHAGEICVIPGIPAREIVQHATEHNINLVVMGAVSRSALHNALIGNTAEKVLDQLVADTLIIKSTSNASRNGR